MVEHIERQTKQKDAIRAALADCEEFISAQDLHRRLEDEGSKIGLATVYRQLNALADAGAADTIRLDGQQLFRLCGDDGHHHHLVCKRCGKPWKSTRPANPGCVRSLTATVLPSNPTPLRFSVCAPTAKRRRRRKRLRPNSQAAK